MGNPKGAIASLLGKGGVKTPPAKWFGFWSTGFEKETAYVNQHLVNSFVSNV